MIRRQRRGGGALRLRRVWNQGRGLIICYENSPQKEFQNSQLYNRRGNRSNNSLLLLKQCINPGRRAPNPTFPTQIPFNSQPRRMETPLLAALAPLTCCVSPHLQFSASAAHAPRVFLPPTFSDAARSLSIRRAELREESCPAGQGSSTDGLLAVFLRHVVLIHCELRELN